MNEAPELLFDVDGMPIALRRDLAPKPFKALRAVLDEGFEWLLDDVPVHWQLPAKSCRYDLAEIRLLVEDIKPCHMRQWREGDDEDSEWGRDAWYFCQSDDPDAVEYWGLPWN